VTGLTTDEAIRGGGARCETVFGRAPSRSGGRSGPPHGSRRRKTCALKRRPILRNLITTVREMEQKQKMDAAEGDERRHLRLSRRAAAGGGESVPFAQWQDCRPPRIFLGRPGGVRAAGLFRSSAETGLSEQRLHSRLIHVPADFEEPRRVGRVSESEKRGRKVEIHTPQRGTRKLCWAGRDECQAQFRAAFPGVEAIFESHSGSVARRAEFTGKRRAALNASISPTFRAPTKWPAWWCGKTAR
jgi:hypothetical protein